MTITLPFGGETVQAELPGGIAFDVLDAASVPLILEPGAELKRALQAPIDALPLAESIRPGQSVLIVVPDIFRESAADLLLPTLVDEVNALGVPDEAIQFAFATGSHRPPTPEEQRAIVGDALARRFHERFIVHNAHEESSLVHLGTTSRGTPVRIHRAVTECDHVITIGAVVFHYFAGFGGGCKMLVPGLAGIDTIAANHAMTLHPSEDRIDPEVRIGAIAGNPIAEDLREAVANIPVTLSINTVLSGDGRLADLFAGDIHSAHQAACECAERVFAVTIEDRADLVIAASAKTRNFVQTHKALYNAHLAVRPGGRVILAAPCPEGLGGEQFERWLRHEDIPSLIAALRRNPEINGQTALSTRQKAPTTHFVTHMRPDDVTLLGGIPHQSLQDAIDAATAGLQPPARCYVLPHAAITVPR